jgi:hypothetical protein
MNIIDLSMFIISQLPRNTVLHEQLEAFGTDSEYAMPRDASPCSGIKVMCG